MPSPPARPPPPLRPPAHDRAGPAKRRARARSSQRSYSMNNASRMSPRDRRKTSATCDARSADGNPPAWGSLSTIAAKSAVDVRHIQSVGRCPERWAVTSSRRPRRVANPRAARAPGQPSRSQLSMHTTLPRAAWIRARMSDRAPRPSCSRTRSTRHPRASRASARCQSKVVLPLPCGPTSAAEPPHFSRPTSNSATRKGLPEPSSGGIRPGRTDRVENGLPTAMSDAALLIAAVPPCPGPARCRRYRTRAPRQSLARRQRRAGSVRTTGS